LSQASSGGAAGDAATSSLALKASYGGNWVMTR
jgi:hypothetical protein